MCYLASAANILAGSEGKQHWSRWERLGSDFQSGFFSLVLLLHPGKIRTSGREERRVLWTIPSFCVLEMESPPSHQGLSHRRCPPPVGTYGGHHDHHHQKAFSTTRRSLNTSTVDRETDDGDLNFPLKICLPEAGPYLLWFSLHLSEKVSCFLFY